MRRLFKDREHLVRLALLFAGAILAFLAVRGLLIPEGFGEYGHYRSGAIADNRLHPVSFAGRQACADCHGDAADAIRAGAHAGVGCEACHGPLSQHAADPVEVRAIRPDPPTLCLVCHTENVAKPRGFPQVDPKEHAGGMSCSECHRPHAPSAS